MRSVPIARRESITKSVRLEEVVGKYVFLSSGPDNSLAGTCPFQTRDEQSHSPLIVYPQQGRFECSSCGVRGDAIDFARWYRNIKEDEALQVVGNLFGIKVPLNEEERKREPLYLLNEQAAELFQRELMKNAGDADSPYQYLRSRGLTESSIFSFRLGFAPNEWDFIARTAAGDSEKAALLEEVGLIAQRENNPGFYDRFRSRIMFPITGLNGRVLGFVGRSFPPSDQVTYAKYINCPETPVFVKGQILYGLDKASAAIRETGEAIVVEGPLDVILAHQHCYTNTVAPSGSAFTREHAKLAGQRFRGANWTILFDGDEGGRKGALRSVSGLLGRLNGHVASMPEGKDPADVLSSGGSLSQILAQRKPFFDFCYDTQSSGLNLTTLEGKSALVEIVRYDFAEIPQRFSGIYLDELSRRLGLGVEALKQAFARDRSFEGNKLKLNDQQLLELGFLQGLLSLHKDLPKMAYFLEVLPIEAEAFSLPEARTVVEMLKTRSEALFPLVAMANDLFFNPGELYQHAVSEGRIARADVVNAIFSQLPRRLRNVSVSDLEEAYARILTYNARVQVQKALERGADPLKIISHLRELPLT